MTAWADSADDLVAGVPDGARIGVSGFAFVRAPIAQLAALIRRGVRDLEYVHWGGGLPLELLLDAGAVRRVDFCFSSLDFFGPAPRFRRALERGTVEHGEWTALAFTRALQAAGQRVAFETLQAPLGSDLYRDPVLPAPRVVPQRWAPLAVVPALELDWYLLHAQRADDAGNVEVAGARGIDLSALYAARRVLVTVEERVPVGELGRPNAVVVPRTHVDAVAVVRHGAYPTSCVPYYVTDHRRVWSIAALSADEEIPTAWLRPSAEATRFSDLVPSLPIDDLLRGYEAAAGRVGSAPWTIDELMAAFIARTVDDASVMAVGSVSPLAMAGYLLGKALWAPASCLITYNGGLIDVPVRPMMILPAEAVDFTLAPVHAGGDDTYLHYYQRGWITHEVVGAAQIDATGATNNVLVRRRDGSAVRLPGQGGMADVANMHRDFFVYVPRHEPRALVETVEFLSASRALTDPSERRAAGYLPGTVRVLTSLGVFEHDPGRARLVLKAVHPGSSVQEVRAHTGFAVEVSDDFEVTAPPSPLELSTLRSRVDPLAIRRLEFVPSAERAALIEELFAAEEGLIRQAAAAPLGARVGVAHGHG